MPPVDKRVPRQTLDALLLHKKEVLANIAAHYHEEIQDADQDSERLFKYGFILAAVVQTIIGGLAVGLLRSTDAVLFAAVLLFLTLSILAVLYERLRIEKAAIRQRHDAEREPIMQQIAMLKGYLEPSDD
ncbi:MAG: hypothetical protein PVI09_18980 [Anaerolineae bacterium]|jgi:hypothetical protein